MSTWREPALVAVIITAVLFGIPTLIWNHGSEERCAIAQMEVRVYERCGATIDCVLTENDRFRLIRAKTDVIKWCEHPLSRDE